MAGGTARGALPALPDYATAARAARAFPVGEVATQSPRFAQLQQQIDVLQARIRQSEATGQPLPDRSIGAPASSGSSTTGAVAQKAATATTEEYDGKAYHATLLKKANDDEIRARQSITRRLQQDMFSGRSLLAMGALAHGREGPMAMSVLSAVQAAISTPTTALSRVALSTAAARAMGGAPRLPGPTSAEASLAVGDEAAGTGARSMAGLVAGSSILAPVVAALAATVGVGLYANAKGAQIVTARQGPH